jgi:flagellar protein FlaG
MSVQPGHLSLVTAPAAATGVAAHAPVRSERAASVDEAIADVIGSTPPADVSEQVGAAAAVADELRASNRELHFSKDTTTGRIVVEVRDLDGNVLKTIPPSKALAIMSGEERI